MMPLLGTTAIIILAFIVGILTKFADITYDDSFPMKKYTALMLGVLWGAIGFVIVIANAWVGAFYLGILLSWIIRYKLDNYSHGIGATLILTGIILSQPFNPSQFIIAGVTMLLFTFFGILSRNTILSKSIFLEYNIYSFIFLITFSIWYSEAWIIVFASIANVIGYHGVKIYWKRKRSINQ